MKHIQEEEKELICVVFFLKKNKLFNLLCMPMLVFLQNQTLLKCEITSHDSHFHRIDDSSSLLDDP